MTAIEVCEICDSAGCRHIRERQTDRMIPETEAQAMVAAAYEAASDVVQHHRDYGMIGPDGGFLGSESEVIAHGHSLHYAMQDVVALTPDDAKAALARLLREAENRALERAAAMFDDLAKDERSADYADLGNIMRSESRAKKHEARVATIRAMKEQAP